MTAVALGRSRPDLIPEYCRRIAETMPLGRPSDINITSITETVTERIIQPKPANRLGLNVPDDRRVPRYPDEA